MDRSREARRGSMVAVNGGLSRRRPRSHGGGLRDSPEDDGVMAMHETTRLRDRGGLKKDRDREISGSRSKRRRGERMLLHGSRRNGEEGSSEESIDDEDDEDEDASVRHPPLPAENQSPPPPPLSSSSMLQNSVHRKSFSPKPVRAPTVWKTADEIIGVQVPRRARTASVKRSHESWVSGGGGGGGDQAMQRQASGSPSRMSPASTSQISSPPLSSNPSVHKKLKQMSGTKNKPAKSSSPLSSVHEIEIEVAEVLFAMTRQSPAPPKQDPHKLDSRDINGSTNEGKPRISSPSSSSPVCSASLPSAPPLPTIGFHAPGVPTAFAPKRRRPRPVKLDDEPPTSPANLVTPLSTSTSSAAKMDLEQPTEAEATSPKAEMKSTSLIKENGGSLVDTGAPINVQLVSELSEKNQLLDSKPSSGELDRQNQGEDIEVDGSRQKETPSANPDAPNEEATPAKITQVAGRTREKKFEIDLMAPPPGRLSPERDEDFIGDQKSLGPEMELLPKVNAKNEVGKEERTARQEACGVVMEDGKSEKSMTKDKTLDLQFDLEKHDRDSKLLLQKQQQQSKATRMGPKPENSGPSASLPLPMTIPGWPGTFPPFGYMGQVPALQPVLPMDESAGSSKALQPSQFLPPRSRLKRCATHVYIAQTIQNHLQFARMNSFWPAAAGAGPLYGAKPYNLNIMPPTESPLLGNPLQGSFTGRGAGSLQDKGGAVVASHSSKEKSSASNSFVDPAQRNQLVVQQAPQPGSSSSMLHGPAFIFPIHQQQAAAAAVAAASRSGAAKVTPGVVNGLPPSSSNGSNSVAVSSGAGGPLSAMNINYGSLPPADAQYLAILQNNGYTIPFPGHVGGQGGNPAQAMPFFNGSSYPSPVLHPPQLGQQPQHQLQALQSSQNQQGHQNASTSSGSSSSQKQPQQLQQRVPGNGAGIAGSSPHGFPVMKQPQQLHLPGHQTRQQDCEAGSEDNNPSTAESRALQAQKSIYGHNFALQIHPQNYALMSPAVAAAALADHVNRNEKQPTSNHHQQKLASQNHNMKVELSPPQAFAMSFAPFTAATAAAAPGLDFSSMAQNHAIYQSLPEAARQGYQISMAAAVHAAQHLKAARQMTEERKAAGDSMNGGEDRKLMAANKELLSVSKQSVAFSRSEPESPVTMLSNNIGGSASRTMTLISDRSSDRAAHATISAAGTPTSDSPSAHQQFIQLQKLQQQHLQQQLGLRGKPSVLGNNGANVGSERLPAGSVPSNKFPQALIQQGGSPTQSPQWKGSARAAPVLGSSPSSASSSAKNNILPQQQGRSAQQPIISAGHQTQISFRLNPSKVGSAVTSNPPPSSAAGVVGSPPNSISKSVGGSPRHGSGAKPGPLTSTLLTGQQASNKSSTSSSSCKSSPVSNRNLPSILGQPQVTSAINSSMKPQQQQQQQQPQKQPFPQGQFIFSHPFLQGSASQSSAGGYYQRRQSEQQQSSQQPSMQQQSSTHGSTGMLTLCSPGAALSTDPSKATAAAAAATGSMKAAPGLLQAAQYAALAQSSGPGHPIMSYMHSMPPMSMKPAADQKPAAGK